MGIRVGLRKQASQLNTKGKSKRRSRVGDGDYGDDDNGGDGDNGDDDDDANVGVNDVMKTKMAMKRLMMDNDDEFDR